MSFIEKTLSDNEKIIKIFKINWTNYFGIWIMYIFSLSILLISFNLEYINSISPFNINEFLINHKNLKLFQLITDPILFTQIILYIISGYLFIKTFYQNLVLKNIEMGLTTSRIILKTGIFSVHNEEIQIQAVETVEVNQSVLQRLLDSGNVKITGRGDSVVNFINVDNPTEIKKIIGNVVNS